MASRSSGSKRHKKSTASSVRAAAAPAATTGAEQRRAPRAPILAQIEAHAERKIAIGRATNVSVGGLLVEAPDTFPGGTTVIVRFFLPPDRHRIEAAGRIVREMPGQSMAITFLGLMEVDRRRIADYVASIRESPVAELMEPEAPSQVRRSGRLVRRVAVVLSWNDRNGRQQQEATETQLLSQHGALVLILAELERGQLLWVTMPDTGRKALSRVVFVTSSRSPGRLAVAVEFLGVDDFWNIEFPPAHPTTPVTRRRSGRLERQIGVVLSWVDELGRPREEHAETYLISDYGAHVHSPVALSVGERVKVRVPAIAREAEAQVAWARPGDIPGRVDLGIELVDQEDFWGLPIPEEPGSMA